MVVIVLMTVLTVVLVRGLLSSPESEGRHAELFKIDIILKYKDCWVVTLISSLFKSLQKAIF